MILRDWTAEQRPNHRGADHRAERARRPARAAFVRSPLNATAQMTTSTAADPAAIHKRSTELAISESTPSINPPYGHGRHATLRKV